MRARPVKYEGQRAFTVFQVDRARFDHILLDHARSLGVTVRESVKVDEVLMVGDRVQGLRLNAGETVAAKYYIDGSGATGFLRRALGIESDTQKALRNIAIWNYW